jgi:hypothetical protein
MADCATALGKVTAVATPGDPADATAPAPAVVERSPQAVPVVLLAVILPKLSLISTVAVNACPADTEVPEENVGVNVAAFPGLTTNAPIWVAAIDRTAATKVTPLSALVKLNGIAVEQTPEVLNVQE